MKRIQLEAASRETSRTSGARRVRAAGYIPGILLGHRQSAVTLKVKSGDMTRVLRQGGPNALLNLSVDGQDNFAMIREFVRHPVTRNIIHVDFMRVAADEPIEAPVPVVITGEPSLEFAGFIVNQELASVRLKALPDSLPKSIIVEAESLQAGHPLHASDLALPEGVELVEDPTYIVAVLTPPSIHKEEEGEGEGEAAEPTEPSGETEAAG